MKNNQTTILNIALPKNTKANFQILAKNMGTTPSNLIKMFITQSLNSNEITFTTHSKNSFTQEELNQRINKSLLDSKKDNITQNSKLIKEVEKWN